MDNANTKYKLRLLMLTFGDWDHASSRERAVKYQPLLEANGRCKIYWIPRVSPRPKNLMNKIFFPVAKRFLAIKRTAFLIFGHWDVIFIQRLFLARWMLRVLKKRRVPIIYDFDDAIYLDRPGQLRNQMQTIAMINSAAQVIVSSLELVPFCREHSFDPVVIPTPVDPDRIQPRQIDHGEDVFTIGWIGSPWTTPYLHGIASALKKVAHLRKIKLLIVGADPEFKLDGIPVIYESWSYGREPELLQKMSVGIMPLPDDEWARGKGGYKLLLYMSAGLSVVASPVGVNNEIVAHGESGFLAVTQEDWIKYLLQLCDDPDLRQQMGRAGREIVMKRFSRAVCFEKLQRCLNQIFQIIGKGMK
jgi:glycosyltransferase involved in cell wall biosynthesis